MKDQSKTSDPTISRDLSSAISLRELGYGALLCVWPDGRITERFGREVAPASLSPRLAKALGLTTSGTYGPPSTGLSNSDGLSSSLASKLRAATDCIGSTLYRLTWKVRVTPLGRSIPALRGSPLRISGKGSTGSGSKVSPSPPEAERVPPSARDWKDTGEIKPRADGAARLDQLPRQAFLCGWPTPCQQDGPNGGPGQGSDRLPGCVVLAGWPTPQAGNPGTDTYNPAGNTDSSRKTTAIASTVELRFIPLTIGAMPTGSCAVIPTVRASGPLNPAHSLWLMLGPFATDWLRCE